MPSDTTKMEAEAKRATELLRGKVVSVIQRHRSGEVLIEFSDKSRIFINCGSGDVDISITEGGE